MVNTDIVVLVREYPSELQRYVLNHVAALRVAGYSRAVIAERLPNRFHASDESLIADTDTEVRYFEPNRRALFRRIWRRPADGEGYSAMIAAFGFALREGASAASALQAASIEGNMGKFLQNARLLHSHSLITSYRFAFARDRINLPIVTTFHGWWPSYVEPLAESKRGVAYSRSEVVLVNSEFSRLDLEADGCPQSKIVVVPQATDVEFFHPSLQKRMLGGRLRLLSVGRLSEEKGFRVALLAVADLRRKGLDIEYVVAGDGPSRRGLERLAKQCGIGSRLKLLGFQSRMQLRALMQSSHLLVAPSMKSREGSPVDTQCVVLQEAQACGMPVVASAVGGIPEFVEHAHDGFLVPPGDVESITSSVLQVAQNEGMYRSMELASRSNTVRKYSIEAIAMKMRDVYEALGVASSNS